MSKILFLKKLSERRVSLTNICPNSNFASASGWTTSGTTLSVSGNIANSTATANDGYYIRTDIPVVSGHVYYLAMYINAPYANANTLFQDDGTNNIVGFASQTTIGSFYLLSGVGTCVKTVSNGRIIPAWDRTTGTKQQFQCKYISIIDLTAAFGAGKEPTKGQMDRLIAKLPNGWVNGTQTAIYNW